MDIPDSVTSIGSSAFQNCTSLTSIAVPCGVTSINQFTFSGCTSLTNITLPDGVTSIGKSAFNGCTSLANINIPDAVTSIGEYAFQECSSFTSVIIPKNVTSIGTYAFYMCFKLVEVYNLSSITITAGSKSESYGSDTTVNGYAGYYAYYVYDSTDTESKVFEYEDYSFICDSNSVYYLVQYNGTDSEITLPDLKIQSSSVNYKINTGAFYGNSYIEKVTLPDSVNSIGEYAFAQSTLKEVNVPSAVTYIGYRAFYRSSLAKATFTETSGWWYSSYATATSGDSISGNLADASAAAKLLTAEDGTGYSGVHLFRTTQ